MSDLVERLRGDVQTEDCDCERCALFREAADRIADLERQLENERIESATFRHGARLATNRAIDLERQLAELRDQPTAQQVGDARDAETVVNLIVRDVCETERADLDLNDTICIDVSDLFAIVKRHVSALSAQEQVEPTDAEILRCAERYLSIVFEEDEVISCVRALLSANQGK